MTGMFDGLLDDAAVFPPGSLSLTEAVPAHDAHLAAPYRALLGPLVVAPRDLEALAPLLTSLGPRPPASSFGTCSVTEPVDDLVRLGLVELAASCPA